MAVEKLLSRSSGTFWPPPGAQSWIALVGPEVEENLSLRYLASYLTERGGFAVEILPYNRSAQLPVVLSQLVTRPQPPLLVGLSLAFQWRALDMLALAVGLKQAGYEGHVTAGGHFGSFTYRQILVDFPELDSICRHEAETTLTALATTLAKGQSWHHIPGLAWRNRAGQVEDTNVGEPPELASLPWPDRRGEPVRCLGHALAPLVGSRGCYGRCSFCCIAAWHAQSPTAQRFRLRPTADVAAEMAWLYHRRGVEIFVFHDDNFLLPSHRKSLARLHELADELDKQGVGRIGTVIKARPNDVTADVFSTLQHRLGCLRVYLGVETDAPQGLQTLERRVQQAQNHRAMRILQEMGLYVCFNMLVFDPDTTVESLETNLTFMETFGSYPFNFGRVELYAGTPLLHRLQQQGRCRGDYLGWDYSMASPQVQRIYEMTLRCFYPRNFASGAIASRLMSTRFEVEVCRHFHPDRFRSSWLDQTQELSRWLAQDSVEGLREIIAFVRKGLAHKGSFERALCRRLRRVETQVAQRATHIEQEVEHVVGCRRQHAKPSLRPLSHRRTP